MINMLTISICVFLPAKRLVKQTKNTSNWTTSPCNKGFHQWKKLSQYQKTIGQKRITSQKACENNNTLEI